MGAGSLTSSVVRLILFLVVSILAFLLPPTQAQAARLSSDDPAEAECIASAAASFRVPELALWVLRDVEAGTLGRVSSNTDGSYDIGPMQINSWWLRHLGKHGVTEDMLLNNLCMNIAVGAWILAQELQRHQDLSKAIAHYHSPTARHQKRYLGLVVGAIDKRLAALKRERALAQN